MSIVNDRATHNNVYRVASNLRLADLRELQAVHGPHVDPVVTLEKSARASRFSGVLNRHEPVWQAILVYGCADGATPGLGVPWMMGTPALRWNRLGTMRFARAETARWLEFYQRLENWVDTRNHIHVRWLQALGFKFGETATVNGVTFQRFYKDR